MSSNLENPTRASMVKGMFYTPRPHLIPEDRWYRTNGMRFSRGDVRMVPRKAVYAELMPAQAKQILHLGVIPAGDRNACLFVALTGRSAWQLSASGSTPLPGPNGVEVFEEIPNQYGRWATCYYNRRLYFTNEVNPVRFTDGRRIERLTAPCGRYVEVFFDHVFVGAPVWKGIDAPWDVRWSHLYAFNEWAHGTDKEGDHYTLADSSLVGGDGPVGITGMGKLGEVLFLHTATSISALQYVGLPLVVRVTEGVVPDRGCGFRYGLAVTKRMHFFPDRYSKTFYRFDGQGFQDIGAPIKDYFWDTLSTDFMFQQRTYAYDDPVHCEVHWVFVSQASSGKYDAEVVYNYRDDVWWAGPVEDVHCFAAGGVRAKRIDEVATAVDTLSSTVESFTQTTEVVPRIWGTAYGRVLREAVSGDALADLVSVPTPYLETGDYLYGSLQTVKEVSSMTIHSKFDSGTSGVQIEYLKERDQLDDTITFLVAPELWTPALTAKRASLPRVASKVHRFRFMPVPTVANGSSVVVGNFTLAALEVAIPRMVEQPPPTTLCPDDPNSLETFDSYVEGELVSGQLLEGECGWLSGWVITDGETGIISWETFTTYLVEDPVTSSLDDGFGWSAPWIVTEAS